MSIENCILKENLGEIKLSLLDDIGVLEKLKYDIPTLFKNRNVTFNTYCKLIKYVYLNDERIHAMVLSHEIKRKYLAVSISDIIYILHEITGLSHVTISKRINECNLCSNNVNILEIGNFKLVIPNFDDDEMKSYKIRINNALAKIRAFEDDFNA